MHSDWFNGIEILQGRWQHAEKVGYSYASGLENTLCKWDIYVPLVSKGLISVLCSACMNCMSTGEMESISLSDRRIFRWRKAEPIFNKFDVSGIYIQLYGYFCLFS
jgi:hypothetical protein